MPARILVVSDSHGASGCLNDIFKKHRSGIDAIFHLGDGCDDMMYAAEYTGGTPTYVLKGNCDVYPIVQPMPRVITEIAGIKIFACHGHACNVKDGLGTLWYAASEQGASAAFFGHTHFQYAQEHDGILLVNPGSARNGKYAIVQIDGDGVSAVLY